MAINYISDLWNPSYSMYIGNFKNLTNFKTNKYLLGHKENVEVFNLAKSRQLLIFQIIPFVKIIFRDQNFLQKPAFVFASETPFLQKVLRIGSQYCNMYKADFPWVNGYFTAKINRYHCAECCIIPDITQNNRIVKEAKRSFMAIIGLVNSNQSNLESISHPVFANCTNLQMCKFFTLLLSSLIAKYSLESFFYYKTNTTKQSHNYKRELLLENQALIYPLFWTEFAEPQFNTRKSLHKKQIFYRLFHKKKRIFSLKMKKTGFLKKIGGKKYQLKNLF